MSTKTTGQRLLAVQGRYRERFGQAAETAFSVVFGDRIGWTLFLGALVFYGLYWRVDVFIIDTFAVANALVSVTEGSLAIQAVPFGPDHGTTPGVYLSNGALYGRNYGQIALTLPALAVLEGLSRVADLRVAITGLWCVSVAGLFHAVGGLVGRKRVLTLAGVSAAALLFAVGVVSATQLPTGLEPLLALQFTTMVAAALSAVIVYRLSCRFHGRAVGTAAGISTLALAPVAFWAPIPKRHAFVALFALLSVYCFARAREGPIAAERRWRAASYVPVGALAWVSAPDGLVLLVVLGPLDLMFARQNGVADLAVIGGVLTIALVPFFLTNVLVSGNPLVPPRMLQSADTAGVTAETVLGGAEAGGAESASGTANSGRSAAAGTETTSAASETPPGWGAIVVGAAGSVLESAADAMAVLLGQFTRSLSVLETERLWHVFVRSGTIPGVDYSQTGGETVELTLLESAPLLAALVATPLALRRRLADGLGRRDPRVAVDCFAVGFAIALTLLYLPRLPLHSTITVRYLAPLTPFAVYGVFRLAVVRRAVSAHPVWFGGGLLGGTVSGVAFTALALTEVTPGTGMQTHAVVNLTVAVVLTMWALLAGRNRGDRYDRQGAALLGITVAAMVVLVLASGLVYFAAERLFVLPYR